MMVDRKKLRNILAMLRPGLADRELSGQACYFIFFENEIVTYNDTMCISHPFESDALFSVKGKEFFQLIDGITDDEINIEVRRKKTKKKVDGEVAEESDSRFIRVESESTVSRMSLLPDEMNKYPEKIDDIKASIGKWKLAPSGLLEGMSLCSFSVSRDITKGAIACVGVIDDKCWGIDYSRASVYSMDSSIKNTVFIPGKQAEELSKFPITKYNISENWIHFRTDDGVTCSIQKVSGVFPYEGIKAIFEKMSEVEPIDLPDKFKGAVENVIVLASDLSDRSGKRIDVHFEGGEIHIEGSNDLGWVEKIIPFEYDKDPIHIKINSKFLLQILNRSTQFAVKKEIVYFCNGPFQHIIMQVV